MWQNEIVKDIYILYRGVHYCRMAYKVAQEQLRKLLEEVKEEEDDFQNNEDRSSSSGSSSHVSGNKQFETPCKFSCCAVDVVEKLTVAVPGSVWNITMSNLSKFFHQRENYEQFVYDISQSCHILETQRLTTVRMIGSNKRESPEDVGIACD